jgi:hypothetical protein
LTASATVTGQRDCSSCRKFLRAATARELLHAGDPDNPVRVVHQQVLAELTNEQLLALERLAKVTLDAQGQ